MNICGIELKANNVILVVLKNNEYIDIKIKKIVHHHNDCMFQTFIRF